MSQTVTAGSTHYVGTNPFQGSAGTGLALAMWVKATTLGQNRRFMALANSSDLNNVIQLGTNFTAATNEVAAYESVTGPVTTQALSSTALTTGGWHFVFAGYTTTSRLAGLDGANENPGASGSFTTTGINRTAFNGRITDFQQGISGQFAHAMGFVGLPNSLQRAYLGAGGNPRYIGFARYWKFDSAQTTTVTDESGNENLTATSAAAGSDDPNIASFWTAAAQGNQSATQGSTFPAIDLTTKFDKVAASVNYTCTLLQVGSAGTATSANGAATTASTLLTTNAALTAGQYVIIGANPLTQVLYASGNSALLAVARTWSNADTVTPYPVSAPTGLTGNGYTITANVTGGTVGAGAVGTYANCFYRATNNTVNTQIADSALHTITVSASGAAPSFSAGPTLTTANTDGYTFGATCNQTATWHAGAYLSGSTTPSVANVKAGAGTGFVAHVTQALTAATPGSLSLTGLTLPIYDVYQLVTNGSGDSALSSSLALMKAPASGKQFVTATVNTITAITKANPAKVTVPAHGRTTGDRVEIFGVGGMTQVNGFFGTVTVVDANNYTLDGIDSTGFTTYTSGGTASWGQTIDYNASTTVATGDIRIVDQVTTPDGLSLTVLPQGAIIVAANGITRRQTFVADTYSVSAKALIGSATSYWQDIPPQFPISQIPLAVFLPANQAITPVNIGTLIPDAQGDTLSVTISGLPAGLSQSGVNMVGTTGGSSITLASATWTNNSTDSTAGTFNVVVNPVTIPTIVGLAAPNIDSALALLYLTATYAFQDDSNPAGPAAQGIAIASSPPAGTPIVAPANIAVTLSTGNAPAAPPATAPTAGSQRSTQLQTEERLGALLSYQVFESLATNLMGSQDPAGMVYRFFRLPASAQILELQIMNDANPSNSSYKLGVRYPNSGGLIVPNSDSVLLPAGLSLDIARPYWTNLFTPIIVNTPASVANVGKTLWQLLGLSQDPSLPTQDALFDVCLTAINPGTLGGNVAIRVSYLRAPDRGLIAASGVHY